MVNLAEKELCSVTCAKLDEAAVKATSSDYVDLVSSRESST